MEKSFHVKENECVGFDSKWKVTKVSIESSSQTSQYRTADFSTNTVTTAEIETQTVPAQLKPVEYDEEKLARWLSNLYPRLKHELEESANSQAFNNYEPRLDDSKITAKMVKTIDVSDEQDKNGSITSLSWNSTGNSLAVTCNLAHKTWCHHNGTISIYTYNRIDEIADTPQMKLQANSCVTVLKYHPILPSIIAGGTFSGEVIVWDTNKKEENVLVKVNAHEEAITQISWVNNMNYIKTYMLATSSLDSLLVIYNFSSTTAKLSATERYKIQAPMFGRHCRKTELPPHLAKKTDRGVIAFDFSKFIPHMFIVAAEGGLVMHCSTLGTERMLESLNTFQLLDPVFKYYKPHEGELTAISFSPNIKELFATNGTDGEVRIYTIEQEIPAKIIHTNSPVLTLSWVPFEEKLLAVCGNKGLIEIYDITKGTPVTYKINEKIESNVLCTIAINTKRISTVAAGTKSGSVQFWTIPWSVYK